MFARRSKGRLLHILVKVFCGSLIMYIYKDLFQFQFQLLGVNYWRLEGGRGGGGGEREV